MVGLTGRKDMKPGWAVEIGRMSSPLRHPVKRIRQELALMRTRGLRLRVPTDQLTVAVFDRKEDAEDCALRMLWSGNPCGGTALPCEYSEERKAVKIHTAEEWI